MPPLTLASLLQILLGLGLLSVWILRAGSPTAYRGGEAKSLREEFGAYGLPGWFFATIGFLKVGTAIALLIGLWKPELVVPAAGLLVILMLGALAMHWKVKDPTSRSVPALCMLVLSGSLLGLAVT